MGFSLIIILCSLGILVFAFVGVFGKFPDNWEWVGIVLAGLGIGMSAPSLLQMIVGKPKILVEFDRMVEGQERALAIFLKNPPIKNKVWYKLGVRRDSVESITVSFRVSEVGTGKIKIPIRQARIYSDALDDNGVWRTTLPPTLSFETSVTIASWDTNKNKVVVPPDRTKPFEELEDGIYHIQVIVAVDGTPQKYSRQFIVGKTSDDLNWVKPVSDKEGSQT